MNERSCSRRHLLAVAALATGSLVALSACVAAGSGGATAATSLVAAATSQVRPVATTRSAATTTTVPARATASKAPTPLVYMETFLPAEQQRLQQILLPDVKRDLPDLALQIVPTKGDYTNLQILIAANSQPDVAMCQGFNPLGMFEDPTAYIAREHFDLRPYNAAMLRSWRWQGTLWCLPVSVGGNGPIWAFNKTRFDNAGVPYPPERWDDPTWTWQELIRRVGALTGTVGGTTTYGFGPMWAWFAHPRPWGGQWMALHSKTVTADTPQMQQAFTVWRDMYTKYRVLPQPGAKPGYGTSQDPLLSGASAIRPIGSWQYSSYVHDKAAAWAFAPIPKGTVTAADVNYFGVDVVKGAKHPDAAWRFTRWLASTPDWCLVKQALPALPKFTDQWLAAVFGDQVAPRRAHLIRDGVAYGVHSDGLLHHSERPQMMKTVGAFVAKLTAGQLAPADMLRQAQTQLEGLARVP